MNELNNQYHTPDELLKMRKTSRVGEIWRRFKQNRMALAGLIILVIIILVAIFADQLVDYKTQVIKISLPNRFKGPSARNWLGTDELGRDILARLIYGARVSLSVGIVAVSFSLLIGGTLGAVAGYYGGVVENLIMRFSDILQAIPHLLLAITIVSAFGQSMPVLMIAVGISSIPAYIRIVRASTLTIKDQEYIEAARCLGARDWQIIARHIINNCMAPIIVEATLRTAAAILSTSSMSFLGLGVKAPTPEWGAIMSGGRAYLRDAWHITLFPGLTIMITILALNLMGDGLRDALDPKLKR